MFSSQAEKWTWDEDPVYNLQRFLPAIVSFFSNCPKHFRPCFCFQEMLAIMKSIYDMMGRYTYPCVRDEAPYEHVDKFFQVINAQRQNEKLNIFCNLLFWGFFCVCLISSRKWTKTGTVSWPLKSSSRLARRFVFLQPGAIQIYRFYIFGICVIVVYRILETTQH